jgi:hypothetical protein
MFQYEFKKAENGDGMDHHLSPSELSLAASQGCYICDALRRRYIFRKPLTADGNTSRPHTSPQHTQNSGSSRFSQYFIDHDSETGGVELSIWVNMYFSTGEELDIGSNCSVLTFKMRPLRGEDFIR